MSPQGRKVTATAPGITSSFKAGDRDKGLLNHNTLSLSEEPEKTSFYSSFAKTEPLSATKEAKKSDFFFLFFSLYIEKNGQGIKGWEYLLGKLANRLCHTNSALAHIKHEISVA